MSHTQTMLNNNTQMYKLDMKNISPVYQKTLQNKLNIIEKEKQDAILKQEAEYNKDTQILKSIYNNDLNTNVILDKQKQEIENNLNKLDNTTGNLMTINRQLEISMDETIKRNNILTLLKIVFICLLLSFVPVMLLKNNKIDKKRAYIILGVIGAVLLFLSLRHLYKTTRNNFVKPSVKTVLNKKKGHSHLNSHSNQVGSIENLIKIIKNIKAKAIKEEDFITASTIQNMLDNIEQELALGNKLGGYSSKAQIQHMINQIQHEMLLQNKTHHAQNQARISELVAAVKKEKSLLVTLNDEVKAVDTTETTVKNKISKVNSLIKTMEAELAKLRRSK